MGTERDEGKPPFDLEQARAIIDKRLLIGISYYDHSGKFIEQKQMYGKVNSVDKHNGFSISLEGSHAGEIYHLPPDMRSFKKAQPGTYRLRSTGEKVIDPDYLSTWDIIKPLPDWKKGDK